MPSRSLCVQLRGTSYTCLEPDGAELPGPEPQLPQTDWAPAWYSTLELSSGLFLAQCAGEAQGVTAGTHYALDANASGSARVEETRLDEHLTRVSMGARRLGRKCLYKLVTEGGLSSQATSVVLQPSSSPRVIPSLIRLYIRPQKAQEESESVALPSVRVTRRAGSRE
jgi:hypothetical protein